MAAAIAYVATFAAALYLMRRDILAADSQQRLGQSCVVLGLVCFMAGSMAAVAASLVVALQTPPPHVAAAQSLAGLDVTAVGVALLMGASFWWSRHLFPATDKSAAQRRMSVVQSCASIIGAILLAGGPEEIGGTVEMHLLQFCRAMVAFLSLLVFVMGYAAQETRTAASNFIRVAPGPRLYRAYLMWTGACCFLLAVAACFVAIPAEIVVTFLGSEAVFAICGIVVGTVGRAE